MTVRMELSRILIRELNDYQIIELREAAGEALRRDAGDRIVARWSVTLCPKFVRFFVFGSSAV